MLNWNKEKERSRIGGVFNAFEREDLSMLFPIFKRGIEKTLKKLHFDHENEINEISKQDWKYSLHDGEMETKSSILSH